MAIGTYANDVWHYIVGLRDNAAGQIRLYVNGALTGTTPSAKAETYDGYRRIGSYKLQDWAAGGDGYYTGLVDEVRISSAVRSVLSRKLVSRK